MAFQDQLRQFHENYGYTFGNGGSRHSTGSAFIGCVSDLEEHLAC